MKEKYAILKEQEMNKLIAMHDDDINNINVEHTVQLGEKESTITKMKNDIRTLQETLQDQNQEKQISELKNELNEKESILLTIKKNHTKNAAIINDLSNEVEMLRGSESELELEVE